MQSSFSGRSGRRVSSALVFLLLLALLVLEGPEAGSDETPGVTTRASVSSSGVQGNGRSAEPAVSADGRFVAFESAATNLVGTPDLNGAQPDIYVRDRDFDRDGILSDRDSDGDGFADEDGNKDGVPDPGTVATVRVSVNSSENQGDGSSVSPAISGDGRFVAFSSSALLAPQDSGSGFDIYVRDRNGDGDAVFDEPGDSRTVLISFECTETAAAGGSSEPTISLDGRFVAFTSTAPDLVPSGGIEFPCTADTNGASDVFVRDRNTDGDGVFDEPGSVSTTRVSVSSSESQSNGDSFQPAVSGNGRFVAFASRANNLAADLNGVTSDVFVRDRSAGVTRLISRSSGGAQGNGGSLRPALSADGRFAAFDSASTNLAGVDANGAVRDVYVRDRDFDGDGTFDEAGFNAVRTTRVSVRTGGTQGNRASTTPAISADGLAVAFQSDASNLVVEDTNGAADIFVHEQVIGETTRASLDSDGDETLPGTRTTSPSISATGRYVAFDSTAPNLVPGDTNGLFDVFVRDRVPTLDIDPVPLDFGERLVGSTSPSKALTVVNEGAGRLDIEGLALGGANPGDFEVSSENCLGSRLRADQECLIRIRFTAKKVGLRSAFLIITSSAPDSPHSAFLQGIGKKPILTLDPSLGPPGFVTMADGELFPPSTKIVLTWKPGLGQFVVRTTSNGSFRVPVLVFPRDMPGPRVLRAKGGGVTASADFLVVPGSMQPSDFVVRR